jgi:hypothetical protein
MYEIYCHITEFLDTELWKALLNTAFLSAFKDSYHAVRATVCESLANLTDGVLTSIPVTLVSITN